MDAGFSQARFERDRFCLCPALLTDSEVDVLTAAMDAITAGATLAQHDRGRIEMEPKQGAEGTKVRRVYEPCTFYSEFRSLSESPKILYYAEQLLGVDLLYTYSKINLKPPEI